MNSQSMAYSSKWKNKLFFHLGNSLVTQNGKFRDFFHFQYSNGYQETIYNHLIFLENEVLNWRKKRYYCILLLDLRKNRK